MMHIKFLSHGTGSGRAAVDYLLRDTDHNGKLRAKVEVLRGNPLHVAQVSDSLDFVHRYTSGVIAWAPEDAPTDKDIEQVINDFEEVAFAGLDPKNYLFLVVLHEDDNGGKHLHVLTPRVHLATGKSLNIAPPGWEKTYDPLRDYYNWSKGWARPDDIERARMVQPGHQALITANAMREGLSIEPDTKELLTRYLMQHIENGMIKNRADIRSSLSELGEITREGEKYISIKPPGFNRAIRLKGAIYGAEFNTENFQKSHTAENGSGQENSREYRRKRAGEADDQLQAAIKRRTEYNFERYDEGPRLSERTDLEVKNSLNKIMADTANDWPEPDSRISARINGDYDVHGKPDRRENESDGETQSNNGIGGIARSGSDFERGSGISDITQKPDGETGDISEKELSRSLDNQLRGEEIDDRTRNEVTQTSTSDGGELEDARNPFDRAVGRANEARNLFNRASKQLNKVSAKLAATARRASAGVRELIRSSRDELVRFKTEINLSEFLAGQGYKLDQGMSCQNYAVMDQGDEKLVVTRATDAHYAYTDAHNLKAAESIIDWVKNKRKIKLGAVRKELRLWISGYRATKTENCQSFIKKTDVDFQETIMAWASSGEMIDHKYMKGLGIASSTINAYSANIQQSKDGTLLFRHGNLDSRMCGYEYKAEEHFGFSTGGQRGLFVCRKGDVKTIKKVVITETALNALSYAQLDNCQADTAYVSTAGNPFVSQVEQVLVTVRDTLNLDKIVLATNNDSDGGKIAEKLKAALSKSFSDEIIERRKPIHGNDWNEELKFKIGLHI
jgi:hypothetical protein